MRLPWHKFSSKEKDEIIDRTVKGLIDLHKKQQEQAHEIHSPSLPPRYYVEETAHMDLCWTVEDGNRGDEGESVCFCTSWKDADLIRGALNRSQT